MTFGRLLHRSDDHGWPRALGAVVVSLVLVVIVYGMARPPELVLMSTSEAVFSAQAAAGATLASPRDAGAPGPAAVHVRADLARLPRAGIDSARECVPEAGITEACIFN